MGQSALLIDDSAILRRIATNVLGGASLRFDVVTATRASEGFARACGTPPSLILVDAHLAGDAKSELCQRLLAEPRTAGIPVVLLLGRGMWVPPLDELPENVVEILAKPFTPEQLLACVKTVHAALKEGAGLPAIRRRMSASLYEKAMLIDRQTATASVSEAVRKPEGNRPVANARGPTSSTRGALGSPDGAADAVAGRGPAEVGPLRPAFQKIAQEGGTGVLSVTESNETLLHVYFDGGSVVVVTTEQVAEYTSGAAGVLPAKVSPATLEAAADEQRRSGVPFLLTLGARGLLSKAAAVDLLHQFGQRFFARVWQMPGAAVRGEFTALDALPGFALRLEPRRESVDAWLLGTLRCVTPEDVAAPAKHDGLVGTPSYLRFGQATLSPLPLTDREREFSRRVDGKLDLPGIAKAMGCTAESAYLLLHRFRALGIMDYLPAPRAFVVTPRTSVRRVLPLRR